MNLLKKLLILVLVLIFRFSLSEVALKVHTLAIKENITIDYINVENINEKEINQYETINLLAQ